MMVRRYNDEHLLFPTHQSSLQQQYFPGTDYTTFPAGSAASHSSSSESEFSAPETFAEVSNSPLRSPDTTTLEDGGVRGSPFLHLVEPPVESCRFRYPTEMKGTHGSILGISSLKKENARKRIFPTVKLCNYRPETPDEKVIIRCTITTADENEEHRLPHVHQLKGKGKTSQSQFRTVEIDDPIDIVVSPPNFLATFGNLTILFIKKENQLKVLLDKKKRHIGKMFTNIHQSRESILANTNEEQLLQEANNEIKSMTTNKLNIACLKFEALRGGNGRILYEPIPSCRPIFSNPIKNIKSAYFSDLRICRIDKVVGSCLGREEVFIFVDKVNKKDIRVRFFELNSDEEEVWYDYAEMGEDDVHFQYAIAFKTPKYKDVTITENVQVYFQLERPSNGSRSAPKEFEYTPDTKPWQALIRKRPRLSSPPIPVTVNELSHPSTSTSTTTWYPGEQSSRDAFLSPVSGLSSDKSSTNTMSSSDDGISDFDAIIRDLEDLEAFFPNIEPMEVEEQGTSILSQTHTSLNEALSLSSFPSGNSEMLSQMMRQDGALESWGSYNGVSSEVIQLLRDNLVTDGVCGSKKNLYVPMKRLTTVQKGLGSKILHNQNDKKLTRDNIVSTVDKVVDGLLKLKKNDRIQDKDMKRYLLGIFATGIEEDYDRVLHVLSAKEKEPTELSVFLNVLKTYDIAETVINLKNNNGQTTLHVAAEKGSLQTISLLVDLGADVNARDNNFNTPVHLVAKRSINDAFYALDHILEKNPDLWIHNEDGLTALHLFVLNRKTDIISSIIIKQEKENAPVDIINHGDRKRGNTPLHMAVQKRFKEIVLLLLNFDNRIDVNVKNFEDKTPLAFVYGENDLEAIEIAELLIENKADPSLVSVKKMLKEVKEFKELKHEDDVDMFEDIDDSLPSYALDWKSGAELKLLDTNTVCSVCPVLDENRNWEKLLKKLDFDEDMYHLLAHKWSPSLYLLKSVAEEMPHVTSEVLRDILIKLNSECKKAAQFIDDMILCKMGVF